MNTARELEVPIPRPGRRPRVEERKAPLPRLGEGLLPLLDPLTVKELRALSRHWQSYVGRVLYVGLVACVLLRWWSETTSHPGRFSSSEFAVLGRTLFEMFVAGQMALVTLAAISAGSDMITKEVRAGTLGLLHLASVSPGRIAASKWKAVMLSATTLALSGLPVMAICIYLGGVGLWELAWSFTLTWTLAAGGASLSILYSARAHGPLVPILKSTAVILGSAVLLIPVAAGDRMLLGFVALFHPIYAAVAAEVGRPGQWEIFAWIGATAFTLWLTANVLRSAAVGVHQRVIDPPPPPRPMNDPELYERNYRRLTRGGPRVVTVHRRIWNRHELLWKEWITRPATRLPMDARCTIALVIAGLLWVLWECSYEGRALGPFYFLGSVFLTLASLNGAVLFRGESLKIDMLLSTPLSTRRIIFTKLLAGLCSPETLVAIGFALAATAGWFSEAGGAAWGIAALGSVTFLLFAFALGAAASLCTRNVRSALMVSSGILGLLAIGMPWIASTLQPLGGGATIWLARTAEAVTVTGYLEGFRTTLEERMAGKTVDLGKALRGAVPFCVLYTTLIAALLGAIFHRFRRLTGRT